MHTRLLPQLLFTSNAVLLAVCMFGDIMFTFDLSLIAPALTPQNEVVSALNYDESLFGMEDWSALNRSAPACMSCG